MLFRAFFSATAIAAVMLRFALRKRGMASHRQPPYLAHIARTRINSVQRRRTHNGAGNRGIILASLTQTLTTTPRSKI